LAASPVSPPSATAVVPSSPTPVVSPSASAAPQEFAGIFDVTWRVASAKAAPGHEPLYAQGLSGIRRVKVSCDSAGCLVNQITKSGANDASGPNVGSNGLLLRTTSGLSQAYLAPSPACPPPADGTVTRTYVGTDPTQAGGSKVFAGFKGSTTVKYQQLETAGTHPDGSSYRCYFNDYVIEYTGVRTEP
jgi:hypothetical protein